jgi:hypothetical protein
VDLGKHPDLQLVLPRGSAVAGRVVDGQDPVEGAEVRLVGGPEDRERRFVRTGPDGRFALAGRSAPGRARLEVRVPGHLPFYREIDLRSGEDADVEVSLPR